MGLLGVAWFTGGTDHGFARQIYCEGNDYCEKWSTWWELTCATQAVGMSCVVIGYATSTLAPSIDWLRYGLMAFGIIDALVYVFVVTVALGIYSFLMLLVVAVAPNLLLLLGISINGWRCQAVPKEQGVEADTILGAKRMTIAWLILLLGSLIQMSGLSFGTYFNHNDIFHVVVMPGFAMMYMGTSVLHDYQEALGEGVPDSETKTNPAIDKSLEPDL